MAAPDDEFELFDVSAPAIVTNNDVSSGSPRRTRAIVIAVVVMTAVVGWSLLTGGRDAADTASEVANTEEAGTLGSDRATEPAGETGDGAAGEGAAGDAEGARGDVEVLDAEEATEDPSGDSSDGFAPLGPIDIGTAGWQLGGTGLTLFGQAGPGFDVDGMVGIDLDNGAITAYQHTYDQVLLQTDKYLVVRTNVPERYSAINLAEPGSPARVISKNTSVVGAREEGGEQVIAFLAAVVDDSGTRYSEMTIDLDIGTIIFRGTLRDSHPFLPNNRLATDTSLFTGPAGGVYEVRGPNFEQVTEGRILGFDDNAAIVERCDDALECEVEWVQRSDWTTIDRPLPPDRFEHALVLGGGRILVVREDFGEPRVFDTSSGGFLDVGPIASVDAVAVSPDGSLIAVSGAAGVILLDTATGEQVGEPFEGLQGPVTLTMTR